MIGGWWRLVGVGGAGGWEGKRVAEKRRQLGRSSFQGEMFLFLTLLSVEESFLLEFFGN